MQFFLIQMIGIIGLLLGVTSFQQKTRNNILIFQFLANLTFTLHFFLLGAYVGCLLNFISALRAVVFYHRDKNWAKSPVWLVFFSALFIAAGAATWENVFSILPIIATVLTTISLRIKNPKYVRFVTLPSIPMWFTYNLVSSSYAGMTSDTFTAISIIIAICRYDIKLPWRKVKNKTE